MNISSTAFKHNQLIPAKYTCDGENINPPLVFSDVPVQAKSLVLIMDDPDAPHGTWVHWILWNINPHTTKIFEGRVPDDAAEGTTSFGTPGYGGPCPPSGTHRYVFKLYALDIPSFDLAFSAAKNDLENAMRGHIITEAQLIGLYQH